jgi:hypothetical protein
LIIKFENVTQKEAEDMFLNTVANKGKYPTVKIVVNGETCIGVIREWSQYGEQQCETAYYEYRRPGYKYSFELETIETVKSPQEIAAEESVRKAESALQAAKDVLGKVKGV